MRLVSKYETYLSDLVSIPNETTGCSKETDKKYWSIAQARKHPWAYYQGEKFTDARTF